MGCSVDNLLLGDLLTSKSLVRGTGKGKIAELVQCRTLRRGRFLQEKLQTHYWNEAPTFGGAVGTCLFSSGHFGLFFLWVSLLFRFRLWSVLPGLAGWGLQWSFLLPPPGDARLSFPSVTAEQQWPNADWQSGQIAWD